MNNPFRNSAGQEAKGLIEAGLARTAAAVEKERFEDTTVEKARQKEGMRIKNLASFFDGELTASANSFPNDREIPPIYRDLEDALFGCANVEKAKGSLRAAAKRIKELQMHYLRKLEYERHTQNMRRLRKEAFGRMIGAIKQNRRHLLLLHEAGRAMRKLPDFREMPTVMIAGLPNTGKTSLLKALTGSEPKIALYPFTTKGLMLGYADIGERIQFIDTPGLLDRPLAKRNRIELQGIAALKHLADMIIYVFDVSETAGYTIEQQQNLLKELKKMFHKPVIIVANKTDIIGGHDPAEVDGLPISCETMEGMEELKKSIKERLALKQG